MFENKYWFEADKEDVAKDILSVVWSLKSQHETRTNDMRRFASLYRNKGAVGFDAGEWLPAFTDKNLIDRVAYNVVKICVDTCVAKLTMQKPIPRFITTGGSWELTEKARLMEKLCLGVMRKADIYRKSTDAVRDAALYGIGFMRVQRKGEEITCNRLHPSRVIIDDQSCLDGDPTVIFVQMDVSREELLANFPEDEALINAARHKFAENGANTNYMITFTEAWHIGVGDRPGRYVACVDSLVVSEVTGGAGLLCDEEWEGQIPIIPIRWNPELLGFWGIGIAEVLEGIQLEITETLEKIQINHQLMATPYLMVPESCGIPDAFFASNEPGKIIKYNGQFEPKLITPPAIHPQVYEHLDRLYNRAFEIVGISQLSAMAQKPAGLNSGVSLRTYLDVESQKFAPISRAWEDMFVSVAKLIVAEAARIPGFKVKAISGGNLEEIRLEDAKMAEDEFEIQTWPASSLPLTPAGRLDRVVEMMQANLINTDEAKDLLDFPDLERFNRLTNAAYEDFQRSFEHMLKEGDYIEPLPWMNLQLGIQLCTSMWLRARMDGADAEKLDLLIRWLTEADDMLTPEPPPVMPEQGPNMGELNPQMSGLAGAISGVEPGKIL